MPSLVPIFVPHSSAHRVVSGRCSNVSVFLRFAGAAVVSFFIFEAMYPAVAVPFNGCHVDRFSSGAVGSSSSFGKLGGECRDGLLRFCEFRVCLPELKCEVSDCF